MKRFHLLVTAGCIVVGILSLSYVIHPYLISSRVATYTTETALHVTGPSILDSNGKSVSLVGLNYGDHPHNSPLLTNSPQRDAVTIKSLGFNAVRLVKEWGALENSSSPSSLSYNDQNFTFLNSQVNSLTGQGLYVIIKLHADSDTRYDYRNLENFMGPTGYCGTLGGSETEMGDSFYSTDSSVKTSGFYHLTQLWLRISQLTGNNSRVIGYDFLNEPTSCSTTSSSTIRSEWHSRIHELIQTLRDHRDNRIVFIEEAPFFAYYGGGGLTFTPYQDPLSNTVSSIHWYRDEYPNPKGPWTACSGDLSTLQYYYSNVIGPSGTPCEPTPVWAFEAQQKYPNQAFDIGEFGGIYGNPAGGVDEQWIENSTRLFREQVLTGWFYWSSNSTGTWIHDLTKGANGASLSNTPIILESIEHLEAASTFRQEAFFSPRMPSDDYWPERTAPTSREAGSSYGPADYFPEC